MPLYIVRNDITKMETDAIVNSANEKLTESSAGVNHRIFKEAGEGLLKECSKLSFQERAEVLLTKGYNLKAKFIIHTLAPCGKAEVKTKVKYYITATKIPFSLQRKRN